MISLELPTPWVMQVTRQSDREHTIDDICFKVERLQSFYRKYVGIWIAGDYLVTRRDFVMRLNVVPPHNAVFLDFGIQCGSLQSQPLCGPTGTADHSFAFAKNAKYMFALCNFKRTSLYR